MSSCPLKGEILSQVLNFNIFSTVFKHKAGPKSCSILCQWILSCLKTDFCDSPYINSCLFPLNGNICSHTIYSSFDSQKLHIFLSFLPIIYISEDFLRQKLVNYSNRQKLVNYSKSNFCFLCNTCRNKSVTYCIQYLAYYCKRGIIIW